MNTYRWRTSLTDENGDDFYVGPEGSSKGAEDVFLATPAEADAEGNRRADLWEEKMGGLVMRLTLERRGRVEEDPE